MRPGIKSYGHVAVAFIVLSGASATRADPVTEWSAILETTATGTSHFLQSRSAAIMHLAIFEAVNAILENFEPYLGTIDAPSGASAEAATVAAAHRVLVTLYPGAVQDLDDRRDTSLAAITDGPAKQAGIAVGLMAADAMLALREEDGSDAAVSYTPVSLPGFWRPTPPDFLPPAFVGWGQVTRFAINDGRWCRV
jgi:hypothetical protein